MKPIHIQRRKIGRGLPTFVGGPHEILRWTYGIAAHRVADHLRSGRDRSDPTEQRIAVHALLNTLTPTEREVLTMRIIVGLSCADTAAVTGLSARSVRITQHRALNRLRHHLGESRTLAD